MYVIETESLSKKTARTPEPYLHRHLHNGATGLRLMKTRNSGSMRRTACPVLSGDAIRCLVCLKPA